MMRIFIDLAEGAMTALFFVCLLFCDRQFAALINSFTWGTHEDTAPVPDDEARAVYRAGDTQPLPPLE